MKKQDVKKIGFFTGLVISVGTTIGAGIFFKNRSILENSGGDMTLSILSWIFSAIGMLAIGLSLVELTNNNRESNGGVLAWTKDYAAPWFHKISRSFMFWIYLPATYVALPMYTVMTFQDTFHIKLEWYWVVLIALSICFTIAIFNQISLKIASRMQVGFILINLIPITLTIVLGFANAGDNDNFSGITPNPSKLSSHIPQLGMIASIPAIFFAYDGFYTAAAIKKNLNNPSKNLPMLMVGSIIAITVIYFSVALALFLSSSDGTFSNMSLDKTMEKVIGCGIMFATFGIINGFSLSAPKIFREFMDSNEIKGSKWFKKMFPNKYGWWMTMTITLSQYIIFTPLAVFGYFNESGYDAAWYTEKSEYLFSFMDLLTNWTSLLIFAVIGGAIIGGLKIAIKTKVKTYWFFKGASIIAIIFILIACLYLVSGTIFSLVYSINHHLDYKGPLLKLIALVVTILASYLLDLGVKPGHRTDKYSHLSPNEEYQNITQK